jgi:hypothetical protein
MFTIQDLQFRIFTHTDSEDGRVLYSARLLSAGLFIGKETIKYPRLETAMRDLGYEVTAFNERRAARRARNVD